MNLDSMPIIDWEEAIRIVGKESIAKELLNSLILSLPNEISDILTSYHANNYEQLVKKIHRTHGALAYSGLSRFKFLFEELEFKFKNNIMDNLPALLDQLNIELTLLLKFCPSANEER